MKQIIYTTLSVLLLSSCVKQAPAPIEYGSSSSRSSGYSETTRSNFSDGAGEITRRELTVSKSSKPTGELYVKEEAFVEYKEIKPEDEVSSEEKPVIVEERKQEPAVVAEQKKLKSLEEEMDEIEAHQKDEDAPTLKTEVNEEIVKPEKVVLDEDEARSSASEKFAMPVSGKIITKFGDDKGGKKSNGIDISAARGAGVKSVAAGKVVYAGQDPKFGNLIIVKVGSSEMFAAYAHMDDLLLKKDDDVAKGQVIGHVGSTGDATTPELHFALRKGETPVDPMGYLSGASSLIKHDFDVQS